MVAQLLGAELLLLSNVPGVLDEHKSLLSELTATQISQLVEQHVITDGMKVKTDAALAAASTLNRAVTIANWAAPLEAILANTTGTRITHTPATDGE